MSHAREHDAVAEAGVQFRKLVDAPKPGGEDTDRVREPCCGHEDVEIAEQAHRRIGVGGVRERHPPEHPARDRRTRQTIDRFQQDLLEAEIEHKPPLPLDFEPGAVGAHRAGPRHRGPRWRRTRAPPPACTRPTAR